MHKLESFALSSGSKIHKPYINQAFYPLTSSRFICVSQQSQNQSTTYDYYDDVIFHIKPYLEDNNIDIYEIGSSSEPPLFYCKDAKNHNINQNSYILNKSLLYLGNYNIYSNIAAHFNKKTICPINNHFLNTIDHYWSSDTNSVFLMDKKDSKPTFSQSENPKTINDIYPEEIAAKVLDLMGIKHNLDKIKTLYIGDAYKSQTLDIIPGEYPAAQVKHNGPINIRMDKSFDINFLSSCFNFKKFNIITDKLIPIPLLSKLKSNIVEISFLINKDTKTQDIQAIESIGIKLNLLCINPRHLSSLRLKFFDKHINPYTINKKKDFGRPFSKGLKFLSKKNILKGNSLYNSYLSASRNKNETEVENEDVFWNDLKFYRIYKENS